MNVLSLFDGLSGARIALERAGIEVDNYYASEIDKYAIQIATKNYPDIVQLGDVTKLTDDFLKTLNIDLLIGGSPCQGFSMAGKRKGSVTKNGIEVISLEQYLKLKDEGFEFDGQSYLFWEYVRVLNIVKPKYFLLENVRVTKKWLPMFNEALGVEPIFINSSLLSAQNRPRFYWTNIPNVNLPEDKGILLNTIFGENPLVHNLYGGFKETKPRVFLEKSPTIRAASGGGAIPSVMLDGKFKEEMSLEYAKKNSRTIFPEECEQLQTLPIGYTEGVSNIQRYRMIGNGFTIDVIAHILSFLKK